MVRNSAPAAPSRAAASSYASAQPSSSSPSCSRGGTAIRQGPGARWGSAGRSRADGERHVGEGLFRLREGAGEDRHAVEGGTGRDDAVGGDQAAGRLEADDAVEGRGDAADCPRCPCRGRGRRCRGPPRPREPELEPPLIRSGAMGVADGAVRGAGADQAGGELVQVGGAQHDRARRAQAGDDRGVRLRVVRVGRAAGGGGQACHVDVALRGEELAREGEVFACGERGRRSARASSSTSAWGRRSIQTSGRSVASMRA